MLEKFGIAIPKRLALPVLSGRAFSLPAKWWYWFPNLPTIENRKTAADEAARQAALETERIKANAAMVEAQKPPNQIILQQSQQQAVQQVQQVQPQRTPRGYTLINDVWVPYY